MTQPPSDERKNDFSPHGYFKKPWYWSGEIKTMNPLLINLYDTPELFKNGGIPVRVIPESDFLALLEELAIEAYNEGSSHAECYCAGGGNKRLKTAEFVSDFLASKGLK
jgi:hypothetical protein